MADTQTERPARVLRETVVLLVVALLLALGVKTFLLQSFYIPSESMEPGLVKNDRILVEKPSYWFGGDPQRGDVVVFADPGGWLNGIEVAEPTGAVAKTMAAIGLYPTGGHLVKRVVGVAGDVIICCDEKGQISVNGKALAEDDFIVPQSQCDGPMAGCSWVAGPVPAGRIFVMGDNRDNSRDSSFHLQPCLQDRKNCDPDKAYVPTDLVVGKVFALSGRSATPARSSVPTPSTPSPTPRLPIWCPRPTCPPPELGAAGITRPAVANAPGAWRRRAFEDDVAFKANARLPGGRTETARRHDVT